MKDEMMKQEMMKQEMRNQETRNQETRNQEMQEAIQAGERALESLYAAGQKLDSAANWGILDILGGGLISYLFKHSRINDAEILMEQARRDVQIFQRELKDVQVSLDLRMEIGSFLSFADFFFDGLIADCLVQSRISETREQLQDAIRHIEPIVRDLKQQMDERQCK